MGSGCDCIQSAVGHVEAYKAVATATFEKRRAEMEIELGRAVDQLQATLTGSVERYARQDAVLSSAATGHC